MAWNMIYDITERRYIVRTKNMEIASQLGQGTKIRGPEPDSRTRTRVEQHESDYPSTNTIPS